MEVWQSLAYCTGLENRRTEMFREFESHRFRQSSGRLASVLSLKRHKRPLASFESVSKRMSRYLGKFELPK